MKYLKQTVWLLALCLSQVLVTGLFAQSMRYGFQQDTENPLRITAVAIPGFSSDNVTYLLTSKAEDLLLKSKLIIIDN